MYNRDQKFTSCKRFFFCALLAVLILLLPICAMAAKPIEITSVTNHGDGTVSIAWDDPNGGLVTVGSMLMGPAEAGNRIIAEFDLNASSYTFKNLAPGERYALLVMPGEDLDNAGFEFVDVPELPDFDDFRFVVQDVNLSYFVPTEKSYSYSYATNLTNDKIYDLLSEKQFWIKIDFSHLVYTDTFSVPILTVVTSPTGYVIAEADVVDITKNSTGFWRTMVYMNNHFEVMKEVNGAIPTGEYSVKVYLDGGFVGEDSFTIK